MNILSVLGIMESPYSTPELESSRMSSKTENPERYPNVSQDLLKENISSIQRGSILNATIKDCREVLQEIETQHKFPPTRLNEINDIAQMTILTRYTENCARLESTRISVLPQQGQGFISKCITLINT